MLGYTPVTHPGRGMLLYTCYTPGYGRHTGLYHLQTLGRKEGTLRKEPLLLPRLREGTLRKEPPILPEGREGILQEREPPLSLRFVKDRVIP